MVHNQQAVAAAPGSARVPICKCFVRVYACVGHLPSAIWHLWVCTIVLGRITVSWVKR